MPMSETELSLNISFSILENKDTCFVNFNSKFLGAIETDCMVDISFFTSGETTIDFSNYLIFQEFDKNDSCSRI